MHHPTGWYIKILPRVPMGLDVSAAPATRRAATMVVAVVVLAFAVTLRFRPGGTDVARGVDDIGEMLAAFAGAAACLWRARATTGRLRVSWALFGAACGSWAAGQTLWTYYELFSGRETPFPSLADIGFLLFPLLALLGLLLRPSVYTATSSRFRLVLDGTMVVCSLFLISWLTAFGEVYSAGAQSTFAMVVGLAYPAGDVVLLTVAVLIGVRGRAHTGLFLLLGGLGAMAVADSAFVYMTSAGMETTGSMTSVGWVAAFLFIGVSSLYPTPQQSEQLDGVESPASVALPYALVLVGGVAGVTGVLRGTQEIGSLAVEAVALLALIARQFMTLIDNRRLTMSVLAQQAELTFRAFHDTLTGLANRSLFYDRLAHALDLHDRDSRPVAVLFCDLDDFKSINDSLGHDAGDALLVAVAERLVHSTRSGDTVARLGGDEFAIVLEYEADLPSLSHRLLETLAEPVVLAGRRVQIRASIGSAAVSADEGNVSSHELLKRADVAMYAAKRDGKGRAILFVPGLDEGASSGLDERLALHDDLRAGRLQAAFQPIVDVQGVPMAFEALARWTHNGVAVPPPRFLEMAERAGLLPEIDLLVARLAIEHAARVAPDADTLVSVNVGAAHLQDESLPGRLRDLLAGAGIAAHRLVIELPEAHSVDDARISAAVERMRAAGFKIAVDDFGIGYSNLARMTAIRPDILKLDRSLITPIAESPVARRVVTGAIALAHDLGALVVAEGVETTEQHDVLRDLECDALQGYLFGRPQIPPVAVEATAA